MSSSPYPSPPSPDSLSFSLSQESESSAPPPDTNSPPPSQDSSSSPPPSSNDSPPPSNYSPPPPPEDGGSSAPPPQESTSPPPSSAPPPSSSSKHPASPPPKEKSPSPSKSPPSENSSPPSPAIAVLPPPNDDPVTPSPDSSTPAIVRPAPDTPSGSSSNTRTPSESTPGKSTPSSESTTRETPSRHSSSSSSTSPSSGGSHDSSGVGAGPIIGVVLAGVVLALIAIFFVAIKRKKKKRLQVLDYRPPNGFSDGYYYKQGNPLGHSGRSDAFYGPQPHIYSAGSGSYGSNRGHGYHLGPTPEPAGSRSLFTFEELQEITHGFSQEKLLGEGGFGCVYSGTLADGREVAIKQLKAGGGQGEREFRAEVDIISRVHHRHLVSLVGYCITDHHRLLVYEFLPNKTVEYHLHAKEPVMDWSKRLKIAIGSARGLAYLHEDCHPKIIHRDIKSANILLDNSFEAQVADFGLAKLSNDTHTHVSTRVMGTFGYMAPEYASSGKLTDRSDVFSFGVVLLELITGRKPVDATQPLGDESLVEWARPLLVQALETGNCDELVDPRLGNNYNRTEMFRMIEAAAACVRHSAPKRPRMVQVVRALESEEDMTDLSNGVKFGQSQVFNSGQYSADIQKFRQMAFGSESSEFGPSGEYDRRTTAYSGEHRIRESAQRPPNSWQSANSSGEYPSSQESETRAFYPSDRSGANYKYNGRGYV